VRRGSRVEVERLTRLAVPIAFGHVAMNLLAVVDTAVLGLESSAALEAGSLGRNVIFACSTIGIGVSLTLESIASQAVSAGEPDRAWRSFVRVLRANIVVWPGAALLALAIVSALPMLPGFSVSPEAARGARLFIVGNLPVLAAQSVYVAARTLLQAHGRTAPTLLAPIVANVLNWLVCNLLVRGDAFLMQAHLPPLGMPGLGALGAGLAGSISACFMCAWVLVAARRHRAAGPNVAPPLRTILRMGSSIGLQLLAEIGAFAVVGVLSVHFGQAETGAFQVALQLVSVTFTGALGVSNATSVMVGYAVGEGRSARSSGGLGIVMGAAVMTVGAALFTFAPRALVSPFTRDPAIVAAGITMLHVAAIFQVFDGVQTVSAGALRGAGDVRFASYCTLFAHWAVGIPLALVLAFGLHLGAQGLLWGLTAGLGVAAAAMTTRFFRISRRIIERV
jgi:MATE family multidrug resistance protein